MSSWGTLPPVDPPKYPTWDQQFVALMQQCGVEIPLGMYGNPAPALSDARALAAALTAPNVNMLATSVAELISQGLLAPGFAVVQSYHPLNLFRAYMWCFRQLGMTDDYLRSLGLNPNA
jgi:hypothetical protein